MDTSDDTLRQHLGVIYGTCRRVLGNDQDAADATQDVVVKWLQARKDIHGSIAGWLHATAHTTAVDLIRHREAQRRVEARGRGGVVMTRSESGEGEAPADLRKHLDAALSELPADERALLIEYHLEGCGQVALAKRWRLSQAHISRRLAKARDLLAGALNRRGVAIGGTALIAVLANEAQAAGCPATLIAQVAPGIPAAALSSAGVAVTWKAWAVVAFLCLGGMVASMSITSASRSPPGGQPLAGGRSKDLPAVTGDPGGIPAVAPRPVFVRDFDRIPDGEQTPNRLVLLPEGGEMVSAIASRPYDGGGGPWNPDVVIKLLSAKRHGDNVLYQVPEDVEIRLRVKAERPGTWGMSQMPTNPQSSSENCYVAGIAIGREWQEFVFHASDMRPYLTEGPSRSFAAGLDIQDIGIYGFGVGQLWVDRIEVGASSRPLPGHPVAK